MEIKTFFRFFSKLPLYIEDSVGVPHSFFTLHLFKDSNIKQISFCHITNQLSTYQYINNQT
jgi:hypothetical protein